MVLLQENGQEVLTPFDEVLERFGATGFIRIPEAEFGEIEEGRQMVGHFNLGGTNHQPGCAYLLVRLVRHGTYKTAATDETPPLLSLSGAQMFRCVRAEHRLPLAHISAEHFVHSYGDIVDHESLVRALCRRYAPSRGTLTRADIESEGVAFTLLTKV
jgi:hypothetical protein